MTVDFYGLFGEITYGLAVGSSTAFGVYFFTVIVLMVAIPTATLWRNTLINRKVSAGNDERVCFRCFCCDRLYYI